MTDEEMQKIVTRLRNAIGVPIPWEHAQYARTDGQSPKSKWEWDSFRCVQAYLAEHPADDMEPATHEWLDAVGVADVDIDGAWVRRCAEFEDGICGKWTRGDVRRLCAALGVIVKE